jgi:hypothetical protein
MSELVKLSAFSGNWQGVIKEDGSMDVLGSYQVSTRPDWGWQECSKNGFTIF